MFDPHLSPAEAVQLQKDLVSRIRESPLPPPRKGMLIGGADCSYQKRADIGFAAVVVCRWPELEIVEVGRAVDSISFPYIPGLLSFRELPLLSSAWESLRIKPEMVVVDGQGVAHPRRLGLAAHAGLEWRVSTVGCAKSRLVGEHRPVSRKRGGRATLFHRGERIGTVLRTREAVKPVFVSPGHLSDFESCNRWILRLAPRFRLPEVIRAAHTEVNRMRREQSCRD